MNWQKLDRGNLHGLHSFNVGPRYMKDFKCIYAAIREWAEDEGVAIQERDLGADRPGEFDGLSVTMNPSYSFEERTYYLAHALGSIVLWSQNKDGVQQVFDDLRTAKENKGNSDQLEQAIEKYRNFETKSSELAVRLLQNLGYEEAVEAYTNFMRADLESMTQYHRIGKAPRWAEFFAAWNQQVANGERRPEPFKPRQIKPFVPCKIERQEIKQEQ